MKPAFLFFVLVLSFSSCKEDSNNKDLSRENLKDTVQYGKEKFIFPSLSPNAAALVKDWPIFRDFQNTSINLQNIPIEDFRYRSANLLAHTDSLAKNIPDTLFTPAIQSRLVVIKTRLSLLHQETKKGKPNPENIEHYIRQTRMAIQNFITQINEKVEKDQIDIQRRSDEAAELEKQRKSLPPN